MSPLPSNAEIGRRIGVSHSMASRIRSGKRLPGVRVIGRISREFDIPLDDLHRAYDAGPEEFGRVFRAWLHVRMDDPLLPA